MPVAGTEDNGSAVRLTELRFDKVSLLIKNISRAWLLQRNNQIQQTENFRYCCLLADEQRPEALHRVSGDSRRDSALLTEHGCAMQQCSRRSSPSFSIWCIATCPELPGERSSSGLSDLIDVFKIRDFFLKGNSLLDGCCSNMLNRYIKKRRKLCGVFLL
jgi:hypothetical protein